MVREPKCQPTNGLEEAAQRERCSRSVVIRRATLTLWLFILFVLTAPAVAGADPISRNQLVKMVEGGVDTGVVLQIVERDCVDFEMTPEVLIELSPTVPKEILEAAISCRSDEAVVSQDRANVALSREPPLTKEELRVLAMIPATLDGIVEDALTAAFVDALRKHRPQYEIVDSVELAVHFEGEGPFHSSAPISSLLAAARAKGADALVLISGTSFRRLEDPGVRLDVKLVEVNQGKVVWSGGDKGVSNFFNMNAAMKNASRNAVKRLP